MNDKLKQSLEGRLNGMRWGEREQAEVFRQIQRKELQDVKHVKRGTGMLAIAMAVLFIVMGAAFALDQLPQPEDTTLLSQSTETEFVPVPSARLENDYLTLTVGNTSWDSADVAFDVTLQLKEPDKYALVIGPYANPGSTGRTKLSIDIEAKCKLDDENVYGESYLVLDSPEVLDMTADSATVRLSGKNVQQSSDILEVTLFVKGRTTETVFSEELDFRINGTPKTPVALWVLGNELINGYIAETRTENGLLYLTLDLVPVKPWYAINTDAPGKAKITVEAPRWLVAYDRTNVYQLISAPTLKFTETAAGMSCTVTLPFPEQHSSIHLLADVTTKDSMTGSEYEDTLRTNHYRPGAYTTPTPVPAPTPTAVLTASLTPTPSPVSASNADLPRSEPIGEFIGGSELVSVFLEEGWYDGFSAEATLRIRADEPSICRLAATPNENPLPSDTTWIVQLDVDETDYSWSSCTEYALSRDEYGDVLLRLSYCDPHTIGHNNGDEFRLDLPITITNERTWEEQDASLTLRIERTCELNPQPLYCVESTKENLFLQGSVVSTGHYHYIGLMIPDSLAHITRGHLLDESGETLATGRYTGTIGSSLTMFPRVLFPYDGDESAQVQLIVIRVDGTVALPELLPIRVEKYTSKDGYQPLADLLLSTTPPQESDAPAQVSIVLDANVLFDNEYVTVFFVDADYGQGHAAAQLCAELKEPDKYTFVENDSNKALTFLDMQLDFNAYETRDGKRYNNAAFAVMTDCDDSASMNIFIHGSSDRWLNATEPVITASMSLTETSGASGASQAISSTAEFAFPNTGRIELLDLVPTDEIAAVDFTYVAGKLISTDYMRCFQLQYRRNESAARMNISCEATPLYEWQAINNQRPDSGDPTLRQTTIYCYPSWRETDDEYRIIVRELLSNAELADFTVEAVPISSAP